MLRFPSIFLLAFAVYASAQPAMVVDKEALITREEMWILNKFHYAPLAHNAAFSERVFDLFLKRLDPQKHFLLQEDVDSLSRFRDSLADQLLDGSYVFCEVADSLLAKRVKETRVMAEALIKQPLNLNENDSTAFEPEKQPYCKNPGELRQRWISLLKYQILNRIGDKLEEAAAKDTAGGKHVKPVLPPDSATVREAVDYVARNLDRGFARMIRENKMDRVALYLGAVANTYDPHTDYMKPAAIEDFELTMTGKLEGIGAQLREDDGYIKVVNIIPGSAAWREKELKAEDKILKVAQGSEEPVDVVNADVDEAVHLIRGKKGTEVRLTVQEASGQIKVIRLIRDVVVVEDSYVKSAVLEPKGSKRRIGYIFLPSFYRDFKDSQSRFSAEDVRQELEKLKALNVDGLILDLRNNGGGSLEDVVAMGGLFIPEGPIVQVKNRGGSTDVLDGSGSRRDVLRAAGHHGQFPERLRFRNHGGRHAGLRARRDSGRHDLGQGNRPDSQGFG